MTARGSGTAAVVPCGPAHRARGRLVAAAASIGARLAGEAVWDGACCAWPLAAEGTLYGGTAGIALFLAELHGSTGDPVVARTAHGALRHALARGRELPETGFGFHAGRVGIAYAAVRAGERLGTDLRAAAEAILRPLAGRERQDAGLDVIAGAAGAVPALLWLANRVDAGLAAGMAERLGEHLLATASRLPRGWSWGAGPTATLPVCGYSHGASGMAHALLELYRATGRGEFRHAAEEAMRYERSCFSPAHGNWPDFRHRALAELMGTAGADGVRQRVRAGSPPQPEPPGYRVFWCHGAPGIALVRLRALHLLGGPDALEEARAALRTTANALGATGGSHCLCHGVAGNAEVLLEGARALGEPWLERRAVRAALRGVRDHEEAGRPWLCGEADAGRVPGLLLGEAGIGLFLLRVVDPAIPSVLLVAPDSVGAHADEAGYRRARERAAGEHFGRTLRGFAGVGVEPGPLLAGAADGEAVHAAIHARVEAERDPERRALLRDAFAVERARFALLAEIADLAAEFLEGLARRDPDEVAWERVAFVLARRTRVVVTRFAWEGWGAEDGALPPRRDEAWLLHRAGTRVRLRPLAPLAAAVLGALRRPATLAQVTEAVAAGLDVAPGDRGTLEALVREQVERAYAAGFVDEAR